MDVEQNSQFNTRKGLIKARKKFISETNILLNCYSNFWYFYMANFFIRWTRRPACACRIFDNYQIARKHACNMCACGKTRVL